MAEPSAWHAVHVSAHELYPGDIESVVLLSEEQIQTRIAELAAQIGADYRAGIGGEDLLLVTVLKGAVMFVSDFARALPLPTQLEFMAVSSYGSSTSSSGVVRIQKDLDRDINDRDAHRGGHRGFGADVVVVVAQPWPRGPRSLRVRAAAEAGRGSGRCRSGLCGLRHPERVRGRLRTRLCRALPRPSVHRRCTLACTNNPPSAQFPDGCHRETDGLFARLQRDLSLAAATRPHGHRSCGRRGAAGRLGYRHHLAERRSG